MLLAIQLDLEAVLSPMLTFHLTIEELQSDQDKREWVKLVNLVFLGLHLNLFLLLESEVIFLF